MKEVLIAKMTRRNGQEVTLTQTSKTLYTLTFGTFNDSKIKIDEVCKILHRSNISFYQNKLIEFPNV